MQWTPEQEHIIEAQGKSLLVSAAAGSGKTAVLVARILRMIADGENPIPVDRLVIMTFTRAAAEEMRERIASALRERIRKEPENEFLVLQKAMLPRARIATIDSICQNLVRQNYAFLELDPNFRVAEEGELRMLQNDVLKDLLEERYEAAEEPYLNFLESYGSGRSDDRVRDLILKLYRFIQANPWPERFLEKAREETEAEYRGELSALPWLSYLFTDITEKAGEYAELLSGARELCEEPGGPLPYLESLGEFEVAAEALTVIQSYGELYDFLKNLSFSSLKPVRGAKYDPERKEAVKAVCDRFRDYIKSLRADFTVLSEEMLLKTLRGAAPSILELLTLTQEFSGRYEALRREKNIVDFNDMEHLALRLLYREEEGELHPSALADALSASFAEILIDEYQDSNPVQEALLQALSAERFGRPDLFMVGDVKQSIYRFRLADPEIFMGKYNGSDENLLKIELNRNFRSRKEVLSSVNAVFERLMQARVGGVSYTKEVALYPGADYADPPRPQDYRTELLMLDLSEKDEEDAQTDKMELEGRMIAEKIRSLVTPEEGAEPCRVFDTKRREFRAARYADIVILLRAPGSAAEKLVDALTAAGIPSYTENASGYFSAVEVETMLAWLSVIDNPHQDIPLAAVLRSPAAGFSDTELSLIRAAFDRDREAGAAVCTDLFAALSHAGEEGASCAPGLREKARRFLEDLNRYRAHADFMPVHRLLTEIYRESGYYAYAGAMPFGKQRRKNLDRLLTEAERFEKMSYSGIFQFVRYIEELRRYDTDYGEASLLSEQDDLVRITSIHKSKGLEYPIVILAGMDRQFNRQDRQEAFMLDTSLGIGVDYVDLSERVRYPGLKRSVLSEKVRKENCGEELRVLYVGMTRAKEKLILTAAVSDAERKLAKGRAARGLMLSDGTLSSDAVLGASSYLDMVLAAMDEETREIGISVLLPAELRLLDAEREARAADRRLMLLEDETQAEADSPFLQLLSERMHAVYACEEDTTLRPKKTVSELKRESEEGDLDDGALMEEDFLNRSLDLLSEEAGEILRAEAERRGGTGRGNAYHRVLQLISFSIGKAGQPETAAEAVRKLQNEGMISEAEAACVDPAVLERFLTSELGQNMADAERRGVLFREQRFMIGLPASVLTPGAASDSLQLLQGIIDAYFENEDGTLTLVDYKTDGLYGMSEAEAESELIRRYGVQLKLYARALAQLTEKEVRERLIYSTRLGRQIVV